MTKILRMIIPLTIAVAIVGFLFFHIDRDAFLRALVSGNLWMLLLGLVPLALAHLFSVWRWRYLVGVFGVHMTFFAATKIYFANLPVAKWTPAYSGDFLRALYLKDRLPLADGASIVLLESMIDVFVLLLFVLLSAIFAGWWIYVGIAVFGILLLIMTAYLLQSGIFQHISLFNHYAVRLSEVFRFFHRAPGALLGAEFLTALCWLQISLFIKLMFLAFGHAEIALTTILTVQPLVTLLALLPVTIGGLGTREGAMLFFYATIAGAPVVLLISLIYSTMSLVMFPMFGLLIGFSEIKKLFHRRIGGDTPR